ncbi:hypothetical protein [Streptomyces sp. NPDC006012]|uniref:hypothetical protein n=1 Tax=Streptomyces sp. NPDC006012 TaxID=3364739 RepID=UPI0036C2511A
MDGYGTEQRAGRLVLSAEYTVRNPTRAPVRYRIAFAFLDQDGMTRDRKWVTHTVEAGRSGDGTVWVPWDGNDPTSGVSVAEVLETPL